MKDSNYIPTGELQGDTKGMPDRGTKTGMNGDTYGASLDPDATNSMGGISGSTGSDAMGEDSADDPTFGPAKGDNDKGE